MYYEPISFRVHLGTTGALRKAAKNDGVTVAKFVRGLFDDALRARGIQFDYAVPDIPQHMRRDRTASASA